MKHRQRETDTRFLLDTANHRLEIIRDDGPCAAVGIYRFDGEYRLPKRKGPASFVGKTTCIPIYGED